MIFLICGLGLIGKQRLQAILDSGQAKKIYVYDPLLAELPPNLYKLVEKIDEIPNPAKIHLSHVVIATPHDQVLKILNKVKDHKPRILMEKPMGRNILEAEKIKALSLEFEITIGFNYRFMAGVEILKQMLIQKELGEVNSIRLDLGHGGAPEDFDSWKLNKESSGGGSLLDPGIHLIDLILHLSGMEADSVHIDGVNYWSGFWKTGIEESSIVLGQIGNIPFVFATSIIAWRTRFSLEIIGTSGYAIVNGRGRSDGPQTITVGRRWGWQNASSQLESEVTSMVMERDTSVSNETIAWIEKSEKVSTARKAYETMKFYDLILSKKSPDELR
jgi:predicted dehydrogenase